MQTARKTCVVMILVWTVVFVTTHVKTCGTHCECDALRQGAHQPRTKLPSPPRELARAQNS
eukprot:2051336-Amphidinium_carterae.1